MQQESGTLQLSGEPGLGQVKFVVALHSLAASTPTPQQDNWTHQMTTQINDPHYLVDH